MQVDCRNRSPNPRFYQFAREHEGEIFDIRHCMEYSLRTLNPVMHDEKLTVFCDKPIFVTVSHTMPILFARYDQCVMSDFRHFVQLWQI